MQENPIVKKENINKIPLGTIILIVCMFAVGFVIGRVFQGTTYSNITEALKNSLSLNTSTNVDFSLFGEVWEQMKSKYVDQNKVTDKELVYGSIKGLVNSYDDAATVFLTPEETEEFNSASEGKYFEGIGAELGYEDGEIIVVSPLEGSPAKEAGIKSGDYILAVDGVEITSKDTVYDIVAKIRGEANTDVTLTILHKGEKEAIDIKITRSEITVPSMSVQYVGTNKDIAVLNIDRFTEATYQDWVEKWDETVKEVTDAGIKKVILDLRGNPGGYFDAAVYAADDFLDTGKIISQQEDGEGSKQLYNSHSGGKLTNTKVVVLVDSGSASASEILAGALKGAGRAVVIGTETYGKGTAQSVLDLSDGSSLHITVLKWLLPDGSWLNKENPIKPDIEVEYSDEDFTNGIDPQLNRAIEEVSK